MLLAGCGFRISVDADSGVLTDGARDTDLDADIDALSPTTCLGKWQAHQVSFSTPALLANIPTAGQQGDPFLTDNELVLFFVWDGDQFVDHDIWVALRTSLAEPFGDSTIKSSISDLSLEDSKLAVNNGDGHVGVIASQRAGTRGGFDLFEGRRNAGGNAAFDTINSDHLGAINDLGEQLDPYLSDDALRLYYAVGSPQEIRVAARPTVDDSFGQPTIVTGIGSVDGDADPTLSSDETVIVFTSNRATSQALSNLWFATRSSATGAFGTPELVPVVNSAGYDGDAYLSPDACRLYFASSRSGSSDLYVAEVQ